MTNKVEADTAPSNDHEVQYETASCSLFGVALFLFGLFGGTFSAVFCKMVLFKYSICEIFIS